MVSGLVNIAWMISTMLSRCASRTASSAAFPVSCNFGTLRAIGTSSSSLRRLPKTRPDASGEAGLAGEPAEDLKSGLLGVLSIVGK